MDIDLAGGRGREAFISELQAFRVRLTAKGRDTYAARSGEHDDLVLAVALAVWVARLHVGYREPPCRVPEEDYDEAGRRKMTGY